MEYVFPCSPQNVTKAINQENNNERLEKDEQDSFKLYLKRVKDCLAGRSKDDSMERLDTIIISVYKFQGEGCCWKLSVGPETGELKITDQSQYSICELQINMN